MIRFFIKNVATMVVLCVLCLMTCNSSYAMRTGRTRQEAKQIHRVALKEARRQARLSSLLTSIQRCNSDQPGIESVYAGQEHVHCNMLESLSDNKVVHRRVRTGTPTLQRVLALAFIGSMLMSPVRAEISDAGTESTLQHVAKIAVSASQMIPMTMPGAMMAKVLISAMPSVTLDGKLDGKLGGLADQAGRSIQNYHDYQTSDPVKARLALSGGMVLGKTVAGAIAGGLSTAPVGGEGAIPGALYGLSKGIVDEMRGIAIGSAVNLVVGDTLEIFIQRSINEFASGLMYLDQSLTEQKAKYLSILLAGAALSSAEFTSVITKLGHIDLTGFKIVRGYEFGSFGQASAMSLGKAIRADLEPELMHSSVHGFQHDVNEALLKTGFEVNTPERQCPTEDLSTADRLFSAEAYQQLLDQASTLAIEPLKQFEPIQIARQPSILETAEAYQQWKVESPSEPNIPSQRPTDLILNYANPPRFDVQFSGHGGSGESNNGFYINVNFRL